MKAPDRGLFIIEFLKQPDDPGDLEQEKDLGREAFEFDLAAAVPNGNKAGQQLSDAGAVHENDSGEIKEKIRTALPELSLDLFMKRDTFHRGYCQVTFEVQDNDIAPLATYDIHLVVPLNIDPDLPSIPLIHYHLKTGMSIGLLLHRMVTKQNTTSVKEGDLYFIPTEKGPLLEINPGEPSGALSARKATFNVSGVSFFAGLKLRF